MSIVTRIRSRLHDAPLETERLLDDAAYLIEAQEAYIELLGAAESELMGFALAHGSGYPPELVARGEELREKIAQLNK